nr:ABC transporter substrate-binding protein [Mangrovicoccus ximenensis]
MLACTATGAAAQSYPDASAIVSIGGPLTEIVYALEQGDRLAARDTTSLYPPEAQALPDVGYMRQLSAEGVLSAGPDLILARDTAGPPEVLEQLQAASVPVVLVHDGFTAEAVAASIRSVGRALGEEPAAEALASGTEAAGAKAKRSDCTNSAPERVSSATSRARASALALKSTPTARAPQCSASAFAAQPVPHPISSTERPGPASASVASRSG